MKEKHALRPERLREDVLRYLEERFGMPSSLFMDYGLYLGPRGRVFLGPKSVPVSAKIVTIGLLVARADSTVKPTTNLLQAFGAHVLRNSVDLTEGQARSFIKGEDLLLAEAGSATDGYILARYLGYPLGCGLLRIAGRGQREFQNHFLAHFESTGGFEQHPAFA